MNRLYPALASTDIRWMIRRRIGSKTLKVLEDSKHFFFDIVADMILPERHKGLDDAIFFGDFPDDQPDLALCHVLESRRMAEQCIFGAPPNL